MTDAELETPKTLPAEVQRGASAGPPEEPFFGDMGQVIQLKREERKATSGGLYFFVWPFFGTILVMLLISLVFDYPASPILLVALVINGIFAVMYMDRNIKPALLLEISKDSAVLTDGNRIPEEVARIDFSESTVVNVVLNEACKSEEFGHLNGWTFRDGDVEISVSVHEGWELWDIQSLRAPVYMLMEHHGMERGPELAYYQEGLRGVLPQRSRLVQGTSPEPPTL